MLMSVGALLFLVTATYSFPFPEECGINYIEPDNVGNATRIVGGVEAVPGSWPWQAYLKFDGELYCGGTLIHPEWVLSAGHCFIDHELYPNSSHVHGKWEIVLGEHDDTIEEGWEQVMEVAKIIVNPDYNNIEIDYDFTLIKLAKPVELNDHVAPACFPSEKDDLTTTFPPGKVCMTTGWGSIDPEGDVWGPTLKQEYAELWSNDGCEEAYGNPGWVTPRMICAGFHITGSEDPERCATLGFGDSGGPLVCRHPDTGRWTHLGATSWGTLCEEDAFTPGAFSNTINMRDWLVMTLEEN